MDLTTCSACALAGSVGGAVTGYGVGRRRGRGSRRRASGRGSTGRTMRAWPGRQRRDNPPPAHGGRTDEGRRNGGGGTPGGDAG
jgi:hypothetical protein